MKRTWFVILAVALLATAPTFAGCGEGGGGSGLEQPLEETPAAEEEPAVAPPAFAQQTFQNVKTPHYVSSVPANNELLTQPVSAVSISFNFTVVTPSAIQVTRDGIDVTRGATSIGPDGLSMNVPVDASETGNYSVTYVAYWPDRSFHNGSFGFSLEAE
ncbi:MAG: copper resistance protein CopC [Candidatus Geothermincolia bacterium]